LAALGRQLLTATTNTTVDEIEVHHHDHHILHFQLYRAVYMHAYIHTCIHTEN
jgi:hypothetical protein